MKFRIEVNGKDSISEGVVDASVTEMKINGKDEWDDAEMESRQREIREFVLQFVKNGEGGGDSVTLEFDMYANTCKVVPTKAGAKPFRGKMTPGELAECDRRLERGMTELETEFDKLHKVYRSIKDGENLGSLSDRYLVAAALSCLVGQLRMRFHEKEMAK